jgi:hypothetical protein
MTVTRQATADTTNLPFIQYCARLQRDSGNSSTQYLEITESFESFQSIPLAGKTVTLSFYGRKGADYTAASDALTFRLVTGTGTDQNLVTAGYTGQSDTINATATLTSTWQRFSATATLPSTVTEMGVRFRYTPVGTASTNDFFEITGVQVEVGAIPTQFSRAGGTIQGELAACQRYYFRANSTSGYKTLAAGYGSGTNTLNVGTALPTQMRVIPTVLDTSALSTFYYESASGGTTPTTMALGTQTTEVYGTVNITKTGAFTAGNAYWLYSNNGAAYLGFSAEL